MQRKNQTCSRLVRLLKTLSLITSHSRAGIHEYVNLCYSIVFVLSLQLSTPVLPANVDWNNPPVTYVTTKHQEVWTMAREDFMLRHDKQGRLIVNRKTHPDRDPDDSDTTFPVYRPETRSQYLRLPTLRPSVLWFLAEKSYLKPRGDGESNSVHRSWRGW